MVKSCKIASLSGPQSELKYVQKFRMHFQFLSLHILPHEANMIALMIDLSKTNYCTSLHMLFSAACLFLTQLCIYNPKIMRKRQKRIQKKLQCSPFLSFHWKDFGAYSGQPISAPMWTPAELKGDPGAQPAARAPPGVEGVEYIAAKEPEIAGVKVALRAEDRWKDKWQCVKTLYP